MSSHKKISVGIYWALVDNIDYERLIEFKWNAVHRGNTVHVLRKDEKGKTIFMHQDVIGKAPLGMVIDHMDRDGLNNTRRNLRVFTKSQNALNSTRSDNAKLVERHGNKWRVRIYVDGIRRNFGSYTDYNEAIAVAKRARSNPQDNDSGRSMGGA